MSAIEKPVLSPEGGVWGSDVMAAMLRALGYRHIALNPGASFRGLHDSLVNHLGNREPQMLLCLHEGNAVAIAHGYAKVSGKPMAVVLHSNVGLMNGTMGLFNAWCDRVPMLVLGATGPVDAHARRPWIDWLHTMADQGALVRPFLKWDNQPASIPAAIEAMLRADQITRTAPAGPVYINFDAALQEARLDAAPAIPDVARYAPAAPAAPNAEALARAVALLQGARAPLLLTGRCGRDTAGWARRVALAEHLSARVHSDGRAGASFPTDHALHVGAPATFLGPEAAQAIRDADVILALDWIDLAGTLRQAGTVEAQIIHATLDQQLHNGFGMEHFGLPTVDVPLACGPMVALHAIADALGVGAGTPPADLPARAAVPPVPAGTPLDVTTLPAALGEALADTPVCMVRLPLGWRGECWHFRHPLDYLGNDGGAGVGAGPGMLIGAAIALADAGSARLPVAVLGDGDTLMAINAFWTAAHYRVPMLAVICNNRSFYNDEVHQERVAKLRNRPVENKWIGQRIGDPDIDIAGMARAQGLVGIGPVETTGALVTAIRDAVAQVRAGASVLIDARVLPGYNPAMMAGLTRHA
jgi:thiamine pyrophosphate-dependent acetolactate synthase large subunit-like protein